MKKIAVQVFKEEDGANWVLFKGEAEALEFLGNVLLAQAKYKKDCHFHIGPKSAGYVFFNKNSTHGIYIHRIPCFDDPNNKMALNLSNQEFMGLLL